MKSKRIKTIKWIIGQLRKDQSEEWFLELSILIGYYDRCLHDHFIANSRNT